MHYANIVFDQVGYIINQYVQEMYKSDIFKETYIISIVDNNLMTVEGFEKYTRLKKLEMKYLIGNLDPLSK